MNASLSTKQILVVILLLGLLCALPFTTWGQREWAYHQFRSEPTVVTAAALGTRYPGSGRAIQAEMVIWDEISRAPQVESLKEYLVYFPAAPHTPAAKELLTKLSSEAAARDFEALSKAGDHLKMGAFLKANPDYGDRGRECLLKQLSSAGHHPPAEVLSQVFASCKDNTFLYCTAGFKGHTSIWLPRLKDILTPHFEIFGLKVRETAEPRLAHLKISGQGSETGKVYHKAGEAVDYSNRMNVGLVVYTTLTLQVPGGPPLWRAEVNAETPSSVVGTIEEATEREYSDELRKALDFWAKPSR